MNKRYLIAGLARSRSRWFSELTRWSTASVVPVDYMKCLTVDEVRAVLGSGRAVSMVLVDAGIPGIDREMIALARSNGTSVVVVDDPRIRRDWESMGASAILDDDFSPEELTETLTRHASPVSTSTVRRSATSASLASEDCLGRIIGVTGPGGSGSSTVAMALAQELASMRPRQLSISDDLAASAIALVDAVRIGDLAMYHDVGDVIPGVPELVDLHRGDEPDPTAIRSLFYQIEDRGYDLLLGQRQTRDWAAIRTISASAAIRGLRRSYEQTVVDADPWLDGESETGSPDIEDSHSLNREVANAADLFLMVVTPGMKGMNDLARLVDRYVGFGLSAERIVPVVNKAPRNPAARSAIIRTIAAVTCIDEASCAPPVFIRQFRTLEETHNCAGPMPRSLGQRLAKATSHLVDRLGDRSSTTEPIPVRRGTERPLREQVA